MLLEFQPFRLEDKPVIESYIKPHAFECSELTFTNMIMWGQDDKIRWAQMNDVLYVRLKFGSHPVFMFPPIPKDMGMEYSKAMEPACKYFSEIGAVPRFRSVSGPFVSLFAKHCTMFTLVPDRNTFDYVYLAQELIALRGRKYHAKRNHVNQFSAQYQYTYRPLTSDMTDACMELYISWLQEKDVNEPGILGEMKAIQFLLPNMERLGIVGGSLFVGDKLVAFTLGEKIRGDMAVIHIEKADASYVGLYAMINQQFAAHAWNDMTYINREEDMGIPGMRKAKLSYNPVKMIEKFDAVWRP